jgi:hypothetical protein
LRNKKEKEEYNTIASAVYENYIKVGQSRSYHKTSISQKHITKLLKIYTKEQLIEYADNYKSSNPDPEYLIACSNFYGTQERFKDFITKPKQNTDKKKKFKFGDVNHTGEIDPYEIDNTEIDEFMKGLSDA